MMGLEKSLLITQIEDPAEKNKVWDLIRSLRHFFQIDLPGHSKLAESPNEVSPETAYF